MGKPRGIGSGCEIHSAREEDTTQTVLNIEGAQGCSPWSPPQEGARDQSSSARRRPKHRHFLETPTFLLTKFTSRMIFWSEPAAAEVQEEVDKHTGQPGATARRWGCCARSRWRLQGLLRPLLPRDRTRAPSRPARHRPRGRSCPGLSQHASRRPSANSISRTPVRHRSDSVRMLLLWAL